MTSYIRFVRHFAKFEITDELGNFLGSNCPKELTTGTPEGRWGFRAMQDDRGGAWSSGPQQRTAVSRYDDPAAHSGNVCSPHQFLSYWLNVTRFFEYVVVP